MIFCTFNSLILLQRLELSGNQIKVIDSKAFNNLVSLRALKLSTNQINTIEFDTFSNMLFLQVLYLNNNQIDAIEPKTFNNLSFLRELYLHNNQITSIHLKIFNNLTSLKHLELWGNLITEIDGAVFKDLESLEFLSLSKKKTILNDPVNECKFELSKNSKINQTDLFNEQTNMTWFILDSGEIFIFNKKESIKKLNTCWYKNPINIRSRIIVDGQCGTLSYCQRYLDKNNKIDKFKSKKHIISKKNF